MNGRMRSWFRAETLVAAVVAIVAAVIALTQGTRNRPAVVNDGSIEEPASHHPIAGGEFEASGVAHVPGSDALLILDDDTTREIYLVEIAADGTQKGDAMPVTLGADVTDMEGITSDGTWFYVVGSQSKPVGFDGDGLVRFKFDAVTRQVEGMERIRELKTWLAENVAELHGTGSQIGDHVLNIEAIAWDARGGRLLLGLRAPVPDGQALVIPIRLVDPAAPLSRENIATDGPALRIDLGGAGIRSLEYDSALDTFRLVTGASLNEETEDFRLVEWSGRSGDPVRDVALYSRTVKPEGITRAEIHGRSTNVLVFDVGSFSLVD